MATRSAVAKKQAKETAEMNSKLDRMEKMLSDVLSLLDPGESPPEQVEAKPRKTRAKKA